MYQHQYPGFSAPSPETTEILLPHKRKVQDELGPVSKEQSNLYKYNLAKDKKKWINTRDVLNDFVRKHSFLVEV